MTQRLNLLLPEEVDKQALWDLREEFMQVDPDGLESDLYDTPDLDVWLARKKQWRLGQDLPASWVPCTSFISVRLSDGLPVGLIDVRHRLNERLLQLGGNIGYCVRPTQRRQGYAKEQLNLALDYSRQLGLQKVLITCAKSNLASAATIRACGGLLQDELPAPGRITQRWWIKL